MKNAAFNRPLHRTDRITADICGIAEAVKDAAFRTPSIPPEHDGKLLACNILQGVASVAYTLFHGPEHPLLVPGTVGCAAGGNVVHPGKNGPDHSAAGCSVGGELRLGNPLHQIVLPHVCNAAVIPIGRFYVCKRHRQGIQGRICIFGRLAVRRILGGIRRSKYGANLHPQAGHGEAEPVLAQVLHGNFSVPGVDDRQFRQLIARVRLYSQSNPVSPLGISDISRDFAPCGFEDSDPISGFPVRRGVVPVGGRFRVWIGSSDASCWNYHAQRLGSQAGSRCPSVGLDGHLIDILAVNRLCRRSIADSGDGVAQETVNGLQSGLDNPGEILLRGVDVLIGNRCRMAVLELYRQIALADRRAYNQAGRTVFIPFVDAFIFTVIVADKIMSLGGDCFGQDIAASCADGGLFSRVGTGGGFRHRLSRVVVAQGGYALGLGMAADSAGVCPYAGGRTGGWFCDGAAVPGMGMSGAGIGGWVRIRAGIGVWIGIRFRVRNDAVVMDGFCL